MTTAVPITTSRVHTARKWGGGAEVQMGGGDFRAGGDRMWGFGV